MQILRSCLKQTIPLQDLADINIVYCIKLSKDRNHLLIATVFLEAKTYLAVSHFHIDFLLSASDPLTGSHINKKSADPRFLSNLCYR